MDVEALPQRPAGGRRSRTQDSRPSKIAKNGTSGNERAQPSERPDDLPEYRSSAELDQNFECKLGVQVYSMSLAGGSTYRSKHVQCL